MRVLVIEDDAALNGILAKRLAEEGHSVDCCFDGRDGLDYAEAADYDCIVLDWMLPKMDGLTLLRRLRGGGNHANVLLLTAKDSIEDRVAGLDAGADDYLVKPFSFDELLARVRALLRRQSEVRSPVLKLDDLVMDTASKTVQRAGKKLLLTSKEYALLEYLLRHQGQTLTRSQISDHVWNFDFDYDSNIVDVYIRYLRNKVDKPFAHKLIHTVRGFGYVMRCGDA